MHPKKLTRKILPQRSVHLVEESYRKARIRALQAKYGFPAQNLRIIGVTGTNGKTTTCSYINQMLKSAGYKTAMFNTATIEMAGESRPNLTHRTVPLTKDLLKFLKSAKAEKVDFVVLEVSSQALDQHKLVAIPIEIAVLTNLTSEHLDYHRTMEEYASAKARLFGRYCNPKYAILNRDDEWYGFFSKRAAGEIISYGQNKDSSVQIENIKLNPAGGQFELVRNNEIYALSTILLGKFNCYNAAAAATVGMVLNINKPTIKDGIKALKAVPGRMEPIEAGQDFTVLVDYAVTPDALENVLGTLKDITKGRVIIVFGATGDRDKSKRPFMGKVAARLADRIFLTDDETYSEDPAVIRAAVMEGIEQAGETKKTTEIADRKEAIKAAFNEAKKDDVVVLAGIGHQDSRIMAGKKIPWDERQVANKLLRTLS